MSYSASDELVHLEALVGTLQRRLWVLEIQIAHYGLAAPAHLVTEQEDTADELKAVQERLQNLQQGERSGGTPYLGLQIFDEDSASLFFGRTAFATDLVERARRSVHLCSMYLSIRQRYVECRMRWIDFLA